MAPPGEEDLHRNVDGALMDGFEAMDESEERKNAMRCVLYLRVSNASRPRKGKAPRDSRSRPSARPVPAMSATRGGCSATSTSTGANRPAVPIVPR